LEKKYPDGDSNNSIYLPFGIVTRGAFIFSLSGRSRELFPAATPSSCNALSCTAVWSNQNNVYISTFKKNGIGMLVPLERYVTFYWKK
jgi:hypothetical protein